MPLQNRVTPEGEIVAVAARGTMMGNRGGALHDADRQLGRRRWVSRQWICCRLAFNGRQRQVMAPGRYTELFFLDEATALAAGHRPCFECRRADAELFARLWAEVSGRGGRATAGDMDRVLHAERVGAGGAKVTYRASLASLPDGAFVRHRGRPWLVRGPRLHAWSPAGYDAAMDRPAVSEVEVLTPRTIVAVQAAGYRPATHDTAG
jgi:hypothetical protein